jgi:vacuolar-type H+-ATPase subunit H
MHIKNIVPTLKMRKRRKQNIVARKERGVLGEINELKKKKQQWKSDADALTVFVEVLTETAEQGAQRRLRLGKTIMKRQTDGVLYQVEADISTCQSPRVLGIIFLAVTICEMIAAFPHKITKINQLTPVIFG